MVDSAKQTQRKPLSERNRRRSGSAFLESAFTILPTFALIFAFVDFGLVMFRWATLQNAVREGCRYAITFQTVNGSGPGRFDRGRGPAVCDGIRQDHGQSSGHFCEVLLALEFDYAHCRGRQCARQYRRSIGPRCFLVMDCAAQRQLWRQRFHLIAVPLRLLSISSRPTYSGGFPAGVNSVQE